MVTVRDRKENMGTVDKDKAEVIHEKSLSLIEKMGLKVNSENARVICRSAGAEVEGNIVRFSSDMVKEALNHCPKEVTLYGYNGDVNQLASGVMYHSTGCHRLKILDYGSGQYRTSTYQDACQLTLLADALDNIDAVTLMVSATEERNPLSEIRALEALVLNTGKHYYLAPQNLLEAEALLDMAEILVRNLRKRPIVSIFVSATSPLVIGKDEAQILIESAKRGAVITTGSCAAAGATSPATLGGTILLQNVEILFLITLAQIINPGTSIVYDSGSTIADLRTGAFTLGAVEYSLITDGAIALANKYQLPFSSTCDTDSPVIDIKNGLQKMLGYFCLMATGVNFSKNAGSLNNGTVFSFEQMVIDNEIIGLVERFFKGIKFDKEGLSL